MHHSKWKRRQATTLILNPRSITTDSLLENRLLQHLPILRHNLLTRDHNNQNPTNLSTPIYPLVVRSPLHHKLPRPHSLLLPTIQPQHNFSRHNRRVITAQSPMHRSSTTRRNIGGAKQYARGWTAREGVGEVRGHIFVGDRDGEAGMEAREGTAVGTEGLEGGYLRVGVEDGGAVCVVAGHD